MKDITIIENIPDFNPSDIDEIMLSIGWSTKEILEESVDYTTYKIFQGLNYYAIAKVENKTVGVLRAYADRDSFSTTMLESIIVHKEYQRRGIGRALMMAFNEKFAHTTTWAITTIKRDRSAVLFLEKFGFKDNSNFTVCSRKRNKELGEK